MAAQVALGLKLGCLVSFATSSKRNKANGSFVLDSVAGEASRGDNARRESLGASDIFGIRTKVRTLPALPVRRCVLVGPTKLISTAAASHL